MKRYVYQNINLNNLPFLYSTGTKRNQYYRLWKALCAARGCPATVGKHPERLEVEFKHIIDDAALSTSQLPIPLQTEKAFNKLFMKAMDTYSRGR